MIAVDLASKIKGYMNSAYTSLFLPSLFAVLSFSFSFFLITSSAFPYTPSSLFALFSPLTNNLLELQCLESGLLDKVGVLLLEALAVILRCLEGALDLCAPGSR